MLCSPTIPNILLADHDIECCVQTCKHYGCCGPIELLTSASFIYLVYMFFGIFQYSFQGQYTYAAAIQSINPYGPQTAGNILSIIGKSCIKMLSDTY